ncbi:MAG: SNF2 helicase-associated domain-containing protein, partial [Polyangiaceae bacterium]
LWNELEDALQAEIRAHEGPVSGWLAARSPLWNLVGRVCFHLAENKADAMAPFAFLATYTTRLFSNRTGAAGNPTGAAGAQKVQHLPLGKALDQYAGAKNKAALLALLLPVQRAAERSALVRALVDSGEIYHPLKWTPREAHAFLREAATLESAGVLVRVPDWWRARRAPRPEVRVTLGGSAPGGLGRDALLDFRVDVALDGEPLTPSEWRALLAANEGLALVRGRWVEVDRARLEDVLAHWKEVERTARRDGISFSEGLRLLAGAPIASREEDAASAETAREWTRIVPGEWLATTLDGLRSPGACDVPDLRATLRPYQQVGVAWLAHLAALGLGGCLADDMGLGKTVQVLALLLLRRRRKEAQGASLLVVPASLIA